MQVLHARVILLIHRKGEEAIRLSVRLRCRQIQGRLVAVDALRQFGQGSAACRKTGVANQINGESVFVHQTGVLVGKCGVGLDVVAEGGVVWVGGGGGAGVR